MDKTKETVIDESDIQPEKLMSKSEYEKLLREQANKEIRDFVNGEKKKK